MDVAFIGLGRMGAPMSARLTGAGHRVRGHDLVVRELDGIEMAPSAAAAAAGAQAVLLMLPRSADVHWVLAEGGVLAAMDAGATVVDMSSSEPMATRELAEAAAERGIELVDAPVSGGVPKALDGTLTIMAGGGDAAVERMLPLLAAMGSRVLHVGPVGAGHALKALNNLLSATHLLASAEAVAVGRRFGLDPQVMIDVINTSSGASASTITKFPNYILNGAFDSGFDAGLMVKDIGIALELAHELEVPAEVSERVVEMWREALEWLPAGADHTAIARWVDGRS
jgi:3-hydroxyisobutyrate dehydrogenase